MTGRALTLSRNPRGVSLAEIILALALFAVVLLVIMQIFPFGYAANVKGRYRTIAIQLAQERLERVLKQVQGSSPTYPTDMGTASLPANFTSFGGDFAQYYYNVRVIPVLDPNLKYQTNVFLDANGNGDYDLGVDTPYGRLPTETGWQPTAKRITITVIGPTDTAADHLNLSVRKRRGVDVVMATYVTDPQLGYATINSVLAPNRIRVVGPSGTNGIRYFTVFNLSNLTQIETEDAGPSTPPPESSPIAIPWRVANQRGLDNVIIDPTDAMGLRQTNRIVTILKDNDSNNNGVLILENSVYGAVTGATIKSLIIARDPAFS